MKHVVLLGDSIFDNKSYIGGGLDVVSQLRRRMPQSWNASLCAVDGSVVENVRGQALDLPAGATHLFVSVGGNNALMNSGILQMQVSASAEIFSRLSDLAAAFESAYREMLQTVLNLNKPTAVCTVYYPRMREPFVQKIAVAALATFNDVIIKQAFLAGIPLIDLRLVCNDDSDYANEIEPSESGGGKIAETILRVVAEHNFERRRTEVFI
jgi:GDSL-like Lipase/Acylhydrolase family